MAKNDWARFILIHIIESRCNDGWVREGEPQSSHVQSLDSRWATSCFAAKALRFEHSKSSHQSTHISWSWAATIIISGWCSASRVVTSVNITRCCGWKTSQFSSLKLLLAALSEHQSPHAAYHDLPNLRQRSAPEGRLWPGSLRHQRLRQQQHPQVSRRTTRTNRQTKFQEQAWLVIL